MYKYSVRLTRKLRYSAQPVTGALSKQLNYLVAVTYVSVSRDTSSDLITKYRNNQYLKKLLLKYTHAHEKQT